MRRWGLSPCLESKIFILLTLLSRSFWPLVGSRDYKREACGRYGSDEVVQKGFSRFLFFYLLGWSKIEFCESRDPLVLAGIIVFTIPLALWRYWVFYGGVCLVDGMNMILVTGSRQDK